LQERLIYPHCPPDPEDMWGLLLPWAVEDLTWKLKHQKPPQVFSSSIIILVEVDFFCLKSQSACASAVLLLLQRRYCGGFATRRSVPLGWILFPLCTSIVSALHACSIFPFFFQLSRGGWLRLSKVRPKSETEWDRTQTQKIGRGRKQCFEWVHHSDFNNKSQLKKRQPVPEVKRGAGLNRAIIYIDNRYQESRSPTQ
jgi:hypothetical protein